MIIMHDRVELSSFPPEVILGIFCSLSKFPDILHLAVACQKHRQIFHDNIITIYRLVSPRAIPCRRYARKLLADQGGSLPNEAPTVQDFLQMSRNSIVIEKSVDHFNETVVIKMTRRQRTMSLARTQKFAFSNSSIDNPGDKRFFDGNQIRPPYLTKCERPRFIRAAYQLWSLILLDPTLRDLRISTLKYKDIYTLIDLAQIQLWADGVLILDKETMEFEKTDLGRVEHLGLYELRAASTRILAKFYHEGRNHVCWEKEYGWMGCISIWENWIEEFKESVVDGLKGARGDEPISEVWYETSDEELMG